MKHQNQKSLKNQNCEAACQRTGSPQKTFLKTLGKSGIYETIKQEAERIEELKEERKRLDEKQNRLTQIILNQRRVRKTSSI